MRDASEFSSKMKMVMQYLGAQNKIVQLGQMDRKANLIPQSTYMSPSFDSFLSKLLAHSSELLYLQRVKVKTVHTAS